MEIDLSKEEIMKKAFALVIVAIASAALLQSCSNLPETPETPTETVVAEPAPQVRPQWFWQGAWWESNGTLAAETRGFLQEPQNAWIGQQATALHANLTGASLPLDFSRATQYWTGNARGVQYVSIPFQGVPGTGVIVSIRPGWYFFGAHTQTLERVEYTRFNTLSGSATPATLSSLGVSSAYMPSLQRAYAKLSIELNASGQYSEAFLVTVDPQNNTVLNTLGARGVVNQAQLNRLKTTTVSSLNVNPCAVLNAPPKCQVPDSPSRYKTIISEWFDSAGNEVPKDSSTVPGANEPVLGGNPDCQTLAQGVKNAKEDEQSIRNQFQAAATGALVACATAGFWVFTNPVADIACLLAAWQAQTIQDDLKIRIRRTQEAVDAYSRSCPVT
jgi:hypothetical protein